MHRGTLARGMMTTVSLCYSKGSRPHRESLNHHEDVRGAAPTARGRGEATGTGKEAAPFRPRNPPGSSGSSSFAFRARATHHRQTPR